MGSKTNWNGSQRLPNKAINFTNKRDEAMYLLHVKKFAPPVTEINGELLYNTVVACLSEGYSFYLGSLYSGRACRLKVYAGEKSYQADCDDGPELETALQALLDILNGGEKKSE